MLTTTPPLPLIPLSDAQKSIWYYEKLYPDTPAYHLTMAFDLKKPQIDLFIAALQALVQRHEILQYRVVEIKGNTYLTPLASSSHFSTWPLQVFDFSNDAPPPVENMVETLKKINQATFITKSFDFDKEVLWRCGLLQFSENCCQFVMVAHHLIVDVTSENILLKDLSELYNAFLEKRLPHLPPLPSLAELVPPLIAEDKLAFWKAQLSDLTPLVMKTDFMPHGDFQYQGDRFDFEVNYEVVQALSVLATNYQVSLHRLFLASLYVLLHRYTGSTDICIGTPSANRRHYSKDINGVVSCFINSIPLRVSIEGNLRFSQVLERLSKICIEAYENQLPFEVIASQAMGKKEKLKTTTASPFDIIFNLNKKRTILDLRDALAGYPRELNLGHSKFSYFGLNFDELPDGSYRGSIEYTGLFKKPTIARLVEHLKNIWTAITQAPEEKIADIFLLTPEECTVLTQANQTSNEFFFEGNTITDIFHAAVKARGMKTAVVFHKSVDETETITYAELDKKAETLASLLRAYGCGPEKRMGVSISRSINLITALWAVFKTGSILVPLETEASELLNYKISESQPKVIIVDRTTSSLEIFTFCGEQIPIINMDVWPQIKKQATQFGSTLHQRRLQPHNLAYITYTSGSTGKPKGVMSTYLGLSNAAFAISDRQLKRGSKVLCMAKPNFDCFFFELLIPLMTDGELHLIFEEGRLSSEILQTIISQHQLNAITLLPQISNYLDFERLPSLNYIVIMGAIANAETIKRLGILVKQRQATVNPLTVSIEYGVQEASIFSTEHPYQFILPHTTIGKPIRNTLLFIIDKEERYECPIGVPGQIYLAGISLARGYFNNPSLTDEKFSILLYDPSRHEFFPFEEKQSFDETYTPDPTLHMALPSETTRKHLRENSGKSLQRPLKRQKTSTQVLASNNTTYPMRLYKTGDRACRLEDGSIQFIGREGNNQVKIHGVRIELDSMATILQTHPQIKDCLITFDAEKETLKGFFVLKNSEDSFSRSELNDFLRQHPLPSVARLSSIFIVDKFPITSNGKTDIVALEKKASEMKAPPLMQPSFSSLQNQLKNFWEEILDLSIDSIDESFAELGGDSLSLVKLESVLNRKLTLTQEITMVALNLNLTIRALSQKLEPILVTNAHLFGNPSNFFESVSTNTARALPNQTPIFTGSLKLI